MMICEMAASLWQLLRVGRDNSGHTARNVGQQATLWSTWCIVSAKVSLLLQLATPCFRICTASFCIPFAFFQNNILIYTWDANVLSTAAGGIDGMTSADDLHFLSHEIFCLFRYPPGSSKGRFGAGAFISPHSTLSNSAVVVLLCLTQNIIQSMQLFFFIFSSLD